MAPLPQNNTARLFFDYVTSAQQNANAHTAAVRYDPSGLGPAGVQGVFLDLLLAIGGADSFRDGWRVIRVRQQDALSDFSIPITLDSALETFEGTNDLGAFATNRHETVQWRFDGRDALTGRRANFTLYGIAFAPSDTFRYTRTVAWVADALDQLAFGTNASAFLSIAGNPVTWYQYVNMQQNSYWESELRTG